MEERLAVALESLIDLFKKKQKHEQWARYLKYGFLMLVLCVYIVFSFTVFKESSSTDKEKSVFKNYIKTSYRTRAVSIPKEDRTMELPKDTKLGKEWQKKTGLLFKQTQEFL